jgi:methylated-DNA-[protein]-cysteine S-methyltransferase
MEDWAAADVPTPIGTFRIIYRGREVRLVDLLERGQPVSEVPSGVRRERHRAPPGSPPAQLREYFQGKRREFDFEAAPESASQFDRAVWRELQHVQAGAVVTYGDLARRAGYAGAARAVGGAMHRNPIPILVPCHRVVGDGGHLTGFGLGLWRKRWLLDHEGAWPIRSRTPDGPPGRGQRMLDNDLRPPPRASTPAG